MKITKIKIQRILFEAFAGFIFWTAALTPYMIWVVKTTPDQYVKWVLMQLIIIPPLAPLSIRFMGWFVSLFEKRKRWRKIGE